LDKAERGYIGDPEAIRPKIFREGIHGVTSNGILGDPRPGDAQQGREYLDVMIDHLTEFFQASLAKNPGS
jgi:creatinine amidohydrolase/Fe(II)-dependent formamide hydrolase-like protein